MQAYNLDCHDGQTEREEENQHKFSELWHAQVVDHPHGHGENHQISNEANAHRSDHIDSDVVASSFHFKDEVFMCQDACKYG